ncbi:MAG: hypothetical protein ACLSH5_04720 [Christensenellales bacterium]
MKRLTVFIICILLLASGCAKKEEKASLFAVDPLDGGAKTDEAALPGPKGAAGLETAPAAEPASTADPGATPSPAVTHRHGSLRVRRRGGRRFTVQQHTKTPATAPS